MGKKAKKQKHRNEEVVVIDLDDDDNQTETLEKDHQRKLPQKWRQDKNKSEVIGPGDNEKVGNSKDECIDLTKQDAENQENEGSSDVVLIEDCDSETERSKRRKLPAYALFRQGVGFTAENLKAEARKEYSHTKGPPKKGKHRTSIDETRVNADKNIHREQKRGQYNERNDQRDRPGHKGRSPARYIGTYQTSQYELRHSPRKHSQNIQYHESPPPDIYGLEETIKRQSPRKKKKSRSRDRSDRSREKQDDRSRSPISERKGKDDRRRNFETRNVSDLDRSAMYFQKYPRKLTTGPVNTNRYLHRNFHNLESSRDVAENENKSRKDEKIDSTGVLANNDNVDGNALDLDPKSAAAVPVKSGALLVLPHPSNFTIKGKAIIQPLVGSVTMMGHILKDPTKTYPVFSPECHSLLAFETLTGESNEEIILDSVSSHLSNSQEKEEFQNEMDQFHELVVLKILTLDSALCDYVTTLTEFKNLFTMDSNFGVNKVLSPLGLSVVQTAIQPHVMVTSELKQAIDDWTDSLSKASKVPPCMMVVGGKDSGKSTTNRLLINSSLNSIEGVYFLECDVGQSEFTPPGCISLHYITQPVLGPPFTHQRKPLCCYFFGGVSPNDDPSIYVDCVERCVQYYQQLGEPGPLIINTMGWVKGLGLQLLVDTMRMISPSHVIQLWCRQKHHNCNYIDEQFHLQTSWKDLTKKNSCWRKPDESLVLQQSTRRQHKLMVIDSISKSMLDLKGMPVRLRPVDFRNLSLLSHFYGNLDPLTTLTSAVPYVIPWRSFAIHVCYMPVPQEQIMYSLNASVVALCHSDLEQAERPTVDSPLFFRSMPVCEWIGFGIVRGVDPVKKELYIVTTVDLSSLKNVNTLLKGSVTLPEQLFMKQHCYGDRLYVDDAVQSLGLATVKPRKHMPRTRTDR